MPGALTSPTCSATCRRAAPGSRLIGRCRPGRAPTTAKGGISKPATFSTDCTFPAWAHSTSTSPSSSRWCVTRASTSVPWSPTRSRPIPASASAVALDLRAACTRGRARPGLLDSAVNRVADRVRPRVAAGGRHRLYLQRREHADCGQRRCDAQRPGDPDPIRGRVLSGLPGGVA